MEILFLEAEKTFISSEMRLSSGVRNVSRDSVVSPDFNRPDKSSCSRVSATKVSSAVTAGELRILWALR